jgi:hypothetical protein
MKRFLLILALATLLLGVLAVPSVARPGEIHSTADAILIEVIDPGDSTITGNMWHLRDFTLWYRVLGAENPDYATGFNLSVVNWNWNLKNGNVSSWGTFETTLDAFDGGFSGNFTIQVDDAAAGPDFDPADPATWNCVDWTRGEAAGQGFGDLDGAQLRVSIDSDSCGAFVTYDEVIFFPGG